MLAPPQPLLSRTERGTNVRFSNSNRGASGTLDKSFLSWWIVPASAIVDLTGLFFLYFRPVLKQPGYSIADL